jgi:hypothetical protein
LKDQIIVADVAEAVVKVFSKFLEAKKEDKTFLIRLLSL